MAERQSRKSRNILRRARTRQVGKQGAKWMGSVVALRRVPSEEVDTVVETGGV